MLSLPKIKRVSLVHLHLPTLVLPLLTLSVTFSSKPAYPDIILHKLFSSVFIICAMIIFYKACRHKLLALLIPAAVIFTRILRYIYLDGNSFLEAVYFVPYSILMLGVGAKMLRDYPYLLLRQIVWISIIAVFLSLLQIMGVQWAQALANFYTELGGSSYDYLFVSWVDLPPVGGGQMRPVGFTQANNVLSQYLLFFYAFTIMWYVNKRHQFQPPLMWLFIISLACALTGAKVVIAGIILLNIAALIFVENKKQIIRIILATCFAYFCYWLFFPGLFVYNYNIDLFAFNAIIRLSTLLVDGGSPFLENIILFMSKYQTGDYMGQRSVESTAGDIHGAITGIGSIFDYLPVILIMGLLLLPFWVAGLRKLAYNPYVGIQKLPIIMMLAIITSSAGGPFLLTSYFWFFFSFALYPLSVRLLSGSRSVWHSSRQQKFQTSSLI